MRYHVTAKRTQQVMYAETVPTPLKRYALASTKTVAGEGPFGYFLHQQLQCLEPETYLWYSNYLLEQEEVFHYQSSEPQLCMQLALSNTFHSRIEGGKEQVLQQGCFNLYYSPALENEVTMRPGRVYSIMTIYFPYAFLKKWVTYFPVLSEFMEKVTKKETAVFCSCNQAISGQMDDTIQRIIRSHYPEFAQSLYTTIKVTELLILALDKVSRYPTTGSIRMHRDDVQRIHEVKEVLLNNLDHPLSLKEMSRQFGINIKKLKTGFKAVFEKSPFDFLLNMRMEKAKELLANSDMSIEDIGESVGYSDKHSFSKAFKQYNGCPPASYRRSREKAGERYLTFDK